MTTELVLLGTAGAPLPVTGRAGISTALVIDGRVLVVDCGRGAPSAFAEIAVPAPEEDIPHVPVIVFDDGIVQVTAVAVAHGRAVPALAYRFDTPDGSVAFSGDTSVNEALIALARGADILVHQVADLGYLKRHGTDDAELARMAGLHTDVTKSAASPNARGFASSSSATTSQRTRTPLPKRNGRSAPGMASTA
jgi:ribonuclease BN (tRNA processing enzyme)